MLAVAGDKMSKGTGWTLSLAFNIMLPLAAVKAAKTLAEPAQQHGVHPTRIEMALATFGG